MDGFTDKLSQHFNSPQDMIAANGQAEATQAEQLQNEVRTLIGALNEKLGQLQEAENDSKAAQAEDYSSQLNDVGGKLENHIHKENVRVYRNVQASVTDELNKQTDLINDKLAGQNELLKAELAAQTETIRQMTEALGEKQQTLRKGRAVLPIQIITMLLVIADLVFNIITKLGLIQF